MYFENVSYEVDFCTLTESPGSVSANELFANINFWLYQDIAGTLATKGAKDSTQEAKLRSALESIDHKRRKVTENLNLSLSCGSCFVIPGLFILVSYE